MQWFQSAFSSSSSPNNNNNSSKINIKDINITYFFRKSKISRRLTRQRKLRHLSDIDIDVGRHPLTNFVRFSENPDAVYNSDLDFASARSSPAPAPQPLPLPELSLFFKDSTPNASRHSESGHFPLPSPKARAQSEEKNSASPGEDGNGRTSNFHTTHKGRESVDTPSTKSPVDRGKKALQERNGFGNVQNNFRVNASSAMSAPGSGVSSPALSPRRMSTGDYPSSPYAATQGFIWSAPEMAAMDMFMDPPVQFSVDKTLPFNDRSPRHARGLNTKSPSSTASPLHLKLSPEISSAWQDCNSHANVHPLPLPPGPTVPSQSVLPHQAINKCEGSKMTGQWQKGKLIGRGTFGSVYVATNRETGALCAMKEVDLIPGDPKSAECMQQLEQEIKVLSQLKHPNIVQYYGSEIVGDHFYIYLEYVHPGSINKYVREHCGAITESVVRSFTRHILHGLAYLHGTKTIHRDIKGANLLVDASGVVKLADFGTAKHLSGQAADLSLKGSPYWMAPEIIHAVDQKDSNSEFAYAVDIWSLGCTIIEIVNGKPPWSEFEGAAAMFKVWKETPPIPEALSPVGKDFLQCCFRRNPAERPSASMLLEHAFVKHSLQTDTQACMRSFSAMKLGDAIQRPREVTTYRVDTMPVSPRTLITKGKLSCNG